MAVALAKQLLRLCLQSTWVLDTVCWEAPVCPWGWGERGAVFIQHLVLEQGSCITQTWIWIPLLQLAHLGPWKDDLTSLRLAFFFCETGRTYLARILWRLKETVQGALTWCLAHYVFDKPPLLLYGVFCMLLLFSLKIFFLFWLHDVRFNHHKPPQICDLLHQLPTPNLCDLFLSPPITGRLQISTSCPSPSCFGSWPRSLLWSIYCQVTSPWTSLPPSWYLPSRRTQLLNPLCPWTL